MSAETYLLNAGIITPLKRQPRFYSDMGIINGNPDNKRWKNTFYSVEQTDSLYCAQPDSAGSVQ